MKRSFDKRAVARQFQPGDKVMVLLPIPGPSLSAKFSGPYSVEEKLSDTDYIIRTPDRKRKKRVCHINMLKTYHTRKAENALSDAPEQPEDDLVVYTSDWPTHMKILSTVFERLEKASLTLNLAKCEFAQATVTYLVLEILQADFFLASVSHMISHDVPAFKGLMGSTKSVMRSWREKVPGQRGAHPSMSCRVRGGDVRLILLKRGAVPVSDGRGPH
ncbi:hypothetical protein MHYP_G00136170 [Metynnis hypsauchen]